MPRFFIRLRRVLGLRFRILAAPAASRSGDDVVDLTLTVHA